MIYPTYAEILERLNRWASAVNGRYLDLDGFPPQQPYQCHDVLLSYIRDCFGLPISAGHAPGAGWTDEVWKQFPSYRPQLAGHFSKHPGSAGLRAGDICFWPYGSRNHPWSHITVAMSGVDANGYVTCVSQNPGPTQIMKLPVHQMIGFLRPFASQDQSSANPAPPKKKEEEDMAQPFAYAKDIKNGTVEVTIYYPDDWSEFKFESTRDPKGVSYNANVALTAGCSTQVPVSYVTVSHYDRQKREAAWHRARLEARARQLPEPPRPADV